MPTLYAHADSNRHKTWFLLSGFLALVMVIGYVFSEAMNNSLILYVAVAGSIIWSFISYWYSDKMVLAMSGAVEVTREQGREIYNLVENLCITAGLPLPKIYIIDDTAPNAFATGRNPEHAVIALSSGLISKLSKAELEGVIAHVLAHSGNNDMLLATVTTVLVGIVVLLADWFRHWAFFSRRDDEDNKGQLGLIIMVVAIVLSILAPIFAYLMQFAISRKREFLADASGALLTRNPDGLARALEKISADDEALEVANRATAHLYISSPFKSDRDEPGFLAKLMMTHPPIKDRVKVLRGEK